MVQAIHHEEQQLSQSLRAKSVTITGHRLSLLSFHSCRSQWPPTARAIGRQRSAKQSLHSIFEFMNVDEGRISERFFLFCLLSCGNHRSR